MFILTNVYPALVIKPLQMDGEEGERLVAPLSREHQLMHIAAELSAAAHLDACLQKLFAIWHYKGWRVFAINIQRQVTCKCFYAS